MSVIQAGQVVYGNVEAHQSPQRRGGFQVLFRSFSRLTEDEVTREIEPRLFFVSENPQDVKHCFYTLPDGRAVLAQCVPDTRTDQFSRKGLYFAHALVLSKEDFRKLDNNPFRVFDNFQFFNSFEEGKAAASGGGGDMPLARLQSFASRGDDPSCTISRDHFLALLLLACRFARSQSHEGAIGFYGGASKTLSILRSLFSLLPIRLRNKCTFDTFFVGGSFGRMPYCAVGFPESQSRDSRLLPFEVERESFGGSVDLQPKTAFEYWLKWMFSPPLSDLSKHVDEALYVSELLDGRGLGGNNLEQGDTRLLIGFQPILENRLRERLRAQIGDSLCRRLFPRALAWLGQQGLAALAPINDGLAALQLEEWLTETYASSYDRPPASEIQDLERFSSRNQRSILWLIYLRWTNQWPLLRSALRSAESETARRFAKWALASVQALVRPVAQTGLLLGIGLYAEGDQLRETVELLSAVLDKSQDEILPTSTADPAGQPTNIPIEHLVSLYALILEKP
jgi:hypothetical protein